MRKTVFPAVIGVIIISGLLTMITGCNNQDGPSIEEIRIFADAITEEILVAANMGDYVEYSKHFDDTLKAAVTEYRFSSTNTVTKASIGDYISKEFWKAEIQNDSVTVYYKAKYSFEPEDVDVKVIFRQRENDWYVTAIFRSSPMLTNE